MRNIISHCSAVATFSVFTSFVLAQEPETIEIETPDGSVEAQKTTIEPFPHTVTIVTGDELSLLESLALEAPAFAGSYVPNVTEFDLADYDRAFRAWQISDSPQHSNQEVVEILGAYLGHRLVLDFDMEWVVLTDEYGTAYAVRSKSVEVMAFPFSTVLKRVESNEYDFLYRVYFAVKQQLARSDAKARETLSQE